MRWRILNKKKSENIIGVILKNRGLKTKKQQQENYEPQFEYEGRDDTPLPKSDIRPSQDELSMM